MSSATLRVRGMDCEGCTRRVRRVLEGLDGVREVRAVRAEDGLVELDLDEEIVPGEALEEALEEAGFPVERMEAEDDGPEGGAIAHLPYGVLALLVLAAGLLGYVGYELYPRFDLPAVEGVALLALGVGAGVASFFSPCAFSLLLALLGRKAGHGGGSGEPDRSQAIQSPFRFALALSIGATVFVLLLGTVIAYGGRALVGEVIFTSAEGRMLRLVVGLFLVAMGLIQIDILPNPLHAVEEVVRPLRTLQAERRRTVPFVSHTIFGFGYLLAGFG